MLRWHSSNAFTLACSCFSFFPPPTTGLLPCIKMNTSSEATKVDLILDWTLICGVDTMSRKNILIPMSTTSMVSCSGHEQLKQPITLKCLHVMIDVFILMIITTQTTTLPSKELDASGCCFGRKIVNTNVGYNYKILPFILTFHLLHFPYLLNKLNILFFSYGPSSLEGKQTLYSHLSREGGCSIHLNIVKLKMKKKENGRPQSDDRCSYFNNHHNLDNGVTFKRTRCKSGCFGWKIVITNMGYIYTI